MTMEKTMKNRLLAAAAALLLAGALPAAADVSVVNGLTHEKTIKKGETYESLVILKNIAAEPAEVRLYQTDYSFTADGRKFYDSPGTGPRSNAGWIVLGQKRIVLPPLGQTEVKYTVRIPGREELAGTYWSMIMVEEQPRAAGASSGDSTKVRFGIRQVMRSGIQVVTHIGETGARKVQFIKTDLLREGSAKSLAIDVLNTGERWLRPFLTADLVDEKGVSLGRFDGGRWRIFPGTSARYTIDFGSLPDGKYKALIVLDNKDESVFGAQYTLDFTAKPEPARGASPVKTGKPGRIVS
jgi:hypothetical protein